MDYGTQRKYEIEADKADRRKWTCSILGAIIFTPIMLFLLIKFGCN